MIGGCWFLAGFIVVVLCFAGGVRGCRRVFGGPNLALARAMFFLLEESPLARCQRPPTDVRDGGFVLLCPR